MGEGVGESIERVDASLNVILAPIFIGINSSGNPGKNYKKHGFLFSQE